MIWRRPRIGLYRVKGIVEAHGGKIEIENPKTGTFTELPQNRDSDENRDVREKSC